MNRFIVEVSLCATTELGRIIAEDEAEAYNEAMDIVEKELCVMGYNLESMDITSILLDE